MVVRMRKVLAMSWYLELVQELVLVLQCIIWLFRHYFYVAGQLRTPIVYLMQ